MIGQELRTTAKNPVDRVRLSLFGTVDLHSHIRHRAMKRYFLPSGRTLEIGAGIGVTTYAFERKTGKPTTRVVYEDKDLKMAGQIAD